MANEPQTASIDDTVIDRIKVEVAAAIAATPRIAPAEFADMLLRLFVAATAKFDPALPTWHVVVIPDSGPSRVESFATVDDAVALLRSLYGQDVVVRVFEGQLARISPGRFKYLNTSIGAYPLFDESAPLAGIDIDTGAMTVPGYIPPVVVPATVVLPAQLEEDADEDDEDDEDDD